MLLHLKRRHRLAHPGRSWNAATATSVGSRAAAARPPAPMAPSWKLSFRMAKPAGLGALAITVRPPPVTAPATIEYLKASETPSTWEPRYVRAALSVMAVSSVAPK